MFRSTLEEHEQIDPAEALMREVGVQLHNVRLERGEDLEQVAENLRIKPAYLEAIERGDLSIMPGRTYALGFLRSYAEHLGFDGEDLIKQIKSTVENLTGHARLHIRTPLPESRLPTTSLVVLSLALVGGIYAGWMYLSDQQRQLDAEFVAEVPDDLRRTALEPLPDATPAQESTAPLTAPATAGNDPPPAEAAAPVDQPVEGSGAGSARGDDPDIQAGVGDESRSGDQATLPPAARQSPTTEAAVEVPAAETSGSDPPPAEALGSQAAGTPGDAGEPSPAAATDALDRIIEGERAASAEVAGDARSLPDAAADRPDAPVAEEAGSTRTDDAGVAPDAGPVEDADDASDAAPDAPARQASLEADRSGPRTTAEDVLAAPGPTASGSEGTPQVYERDNADARVVIRARARSWIRITSAGGDYLRTRTLEEGDVFLVPDRADLSLWTGNAGGIQMIVDGRTLPLLGPEGTVKRDIPLDPESLVAQADTER